MRVAGIVLTICAIAVTAFVPARLMAGTLPNISGVWYAQGDSWKRCHISQSGSSVTLQNEQGRTASATFTNPSTIDADWGYFGGRHITGTISRNLKRIAWSNGTYWTRESESGPAPTPRPTPTATPTPMPPRLVVSTRVEGNESSPIYVYAASLSNGYGSTFSQCVSFRNVSNKEATDVDFSFVVTRYSGHVEADFGYVDRGTFTPPIAIDRHCWSGRLWPRRTVELMSHETVRVKSVTFADGTVWKPGERFVRAYGNGGAPLEHAIEEDGGTP